MDDDAGRTRRLLERWAGADAELVETHISVLAFRGSRVYKMKKPVRFAFVDLSTRELRARDCAREVALNRRLAPDVYLGVVEVPDPEHHTTEPAVEMRRMPSARRLSGLVSGPDRDDTSAQRCVARVATLVAQFHAGARRDAAIDAASGSIALEGLWQAGFDQTRPFLGTMLPADDAARVEALVRRYLAGRRGLLDGRVAAGHARDGHGDLLADDVFCLPDGPRILDCLEFDDRLRAGDVLHDVAFLAMDLERLGRADLARRFLDCYRDAARDEWPVSLMDFHIAYRAHVRTKVACLAADQHDASDAPEAVALLQLARRHLEHGRVRLVLVGGAPGTGKTTLARALGAERGWPVLRSDVVRKQLAGMDPTTPAAAALDSGLYTPELRARTYSALLDATRDLLRGGESVVLDASWASTDHRAAARRVADETASDVVAIECRAPAPLVAARLARRAASGDASDVGAELAPTLAARVTPWPDAVRIDTADEADARARARSAVGP